MPYKCAFQNRQNADRNGGYSENFYNASASDTEITQRVTDLGNALFQLKGFGGNVDACRVSDLDNFRAAVLVPLDLTSVPVGGVQDADGLTAKVQIKLSGDDTKKSTTQWIGSVPDNVIARGGKFTWTSAFKSNWGKVRGLLIANGWSVRKLNPAAAPKRPVASVTQAGVVTTAAAHGLDGNPIVRLGRVKHPTVVNGLYRINVLTATTVQLIGFVDPGEAITVRTSTYLQAQVYALTQITHADVIRATSHKVGRPFNLSIGRRPIQ